MPDTHRRVRLTTDHPQSNFHRPVILVDDKPLYGVTEIRYECKYNGEIPKVQLTLLGVDIELEGAPEYLVRVVGPGPKKESSHE